MKKRTVLTGFYPTKLPVNGTILWAFLLWFFKAPDIIFGVFLTLAGILWAFSIYLICIEQRIDINSDKPKETEKLSKFQEKMAQMLKEAEEKKAAQK